METRQESAQGQHPPGDGEKDAGRNLTRLVAVCGALLGVAAVVEAAMRAHPEGFVLSRETLRWVARDTMMFIGLACLSLIGVSAYIGRRVQPMKNVIVAVTTGALGATAAIALAWALGAEVDLKNGTTAPAHIGEPMNAPQGRGEVE